MTNAGYILISPVRNEAQYLPLTIASVCGQSVLPRRWVIVDDGSTDATGAIADAAGGQYPWISVVHRGDRGFRQAGGGVMEAFYDGYRLVADEPWNYLVKLDGDLSFDRGYFQGCFDRFDADPKLGVGGGTVCSQLDGVLEVESAIDPAFHVRGATKIYRRECWDAIGGLVRAPGWDTLDEVKANMLGWATRTFSDVRLIHHRPAGAAYGLWRDWVKNGHANYVAGYHPVFMIVKCLRRMFERPYVITGCGLFWGFLRGYLTRMPQVQDRQLIRYFRRQQMNRLMGRSSLWDPAH